mgnify:CR=1 FL=1
MKNSVQLANRFREVLLDGKWVANTNYKELLSEIGWQQATKRVTTLNTIAAITAHINYYLEGVLNVFEGGNLEIHDKYSFDFPPLQSEEAWNELRSRLFANAENFAVHIESHSDTDLDEIFVDPKYGTYARNIEGMIEHCYYHLGQISLLNKLTQE